MSGFKEKGDEWWVEKNVELFETWENLIEGIIGVFLDLQIKNPTLADSLLDSSDSNNDYNEDQIIIARFAVPLLRDRENEFF